MTVITTILDTLRDKANRTLIKVRRFGKSDIQTAPQVAPFGIDSNPIDGLKAIYSETAEKGKTVIIGYLLPNQLAAKGEIRLFSTDSNGALKIFLWLKADGTIQFGASSDNLVRYSKMADTIKELQDDLKAIKQVFKTTWVVTPMDGGAALKAAAATWANTALAKDISLSKINELKTS